LISPVNYNSIQDIEKMNKKMVTPKNLSVASTPIRYNLNKIAIRMSQRTTFQHYTRSTSPNTPANNILKAGNTAIFKTNLRRFFKHNKHYSIKLGTEISSCKMNRSIQSIIYKKLFKFPKKDFITRLNIEQPSKSIYSALNLYGNRKSKSITEPLKANHHMFKKEDLINKVIK